MIFTRLLLYASLLATIVIRISLFASATPYFITTNLGNFNHDAASGNPLKGFLTSPDWNTDQELNSFPSSLEFYYVGLDKVMTNFNTFDWDTYLEPRLSDSASRNRHVILRFIMDYPGEETYVPQFLIDGGLSFTNYEVFGDSGKSPNYNDANLRTALLQFIQAFGEKYDGDRRIGFVQVGLLGFWGEWHTWTGDEATDSWIPDSLKNDVVSSFASYFSDTQVQVRYPWTTAVEAGFGLHDDSFAYETLDGVYNGGKNHDWFFWRLVEDASYTNFWKSAAMGGEIYPDLQSVIFRDSYAAGTSYKQDFFDCTDVTHATYMLNYEAFSPGYSGTALTKATLGSNSLGYAFQVTKVEVEETSNVDAVSMTIHITQKGVAPFYYPLDLTLSCAGMSTQSQPGVEQIIEKGSSASFIFSNIPANANCLDAVEIALYSTYIYDGNPVKFTQGVDGTSVIVSVPLPSPVTSPTASPVSLPTPTPPSINTCVDSSLRFKLIWKNKRIARSCAWVANKDTIFRCAVDGVSAHCSYTCGSCNMCQDSNVRFKLEWNGKNIWRNCIWVGKKSTWNRCKVDGVSDSCHSTCSKC